MMRLRSIPTQLVVGALLIGISLTGCGINGPLETPPPKDEERDDAALAIEEPGDRA